MATEENSNQIIAQASQNNQDLLGKIEILNSHTETLRSEAQERNAEANSRLNDTATKLKTMMQDFLQLYVRKNVYEGDQNMLE